MQHSDTAPTLQGFIRIKTWLQLTPFLLSLLQLYRPEMILRPRSDPRTKPEE